jgi:uncharacterized protein YceK
VVWFPRYVLVVLAVVFVLAGCDSASSIPAGAQQVHVDATGATVSVAPATVRAGDVYLVVDLPAQGASLAMIQGAGGALTDADLARFSQAGDQQGLSFVGIDNSCCGKVHKMTLTAGAYGFILHADSVRPGVPPSAVTVLEVTP